MRAICLSTVASKHRFKSARRSVLVISAIALLSSCSPKVQDGGSPASIAARQSIYGELSQLENSLSRMSVSDSLQKKTDFLTASRGTYPVSPAEFEIARNRRVLAMEELASMPVPSDDASDFSAFWEIHQAYRNAIQTARYGHGTMSLIYSRPYPGDHLGGPMAELIQIISDAEAGYPVDEDRIAAGANNRYAEALHKLRQRLDVDLAAGFAPPPEIVDLMIKQIDDSPFASREKMLAYRDALNAAEAEKSLPLQDTENEIVEAPFSPRIQNILVAAIQLEVSSLRDELVILKESWESDLPLIESGEAFYDAVLRQVTNGAVDGEQCYSLASRKIEDTYAELVGLLNSDEAITDAPSQEYSDTISLKTRFLDWQASAPLFTPPEVIVPDDASLPAPAPLPAPVLPEPTLFETFLHAVDTVEPSFRIIVRRTIPEPVVSEVPALPPPMTRGSRPVQPTITFPDFSVSMRGDGTAFTIQQDTLATTPMGFAVMDFLMKSYPGTALPGLVEEKQENIPTLARELTSPAFDLGWPYYVMEALDRRGAFDESGRPLHG